MSGIEYTGTPRDHLSRRRLLQAALGAGTLAATGFSVSACGGDDEGGGEIPSDPKDVSGDITMWIYPIDPVSEKKWWKPEIERFNKEYPDVNVNVTVQPWEERDTQLQTAIAGQKGPDVFYIIPDQVPVYASQGVLADMAGVIEGDDDFRENALEAMTFEDKLCGVPLLMGGSASMVHMKLLDEAGITDKPQTWDDLREIAPALKAKGYYVTHYVAALEQTLNLSFYPFLWQAGGDVLNDDGSAAAFNSPEGLEALTFIKELVDNEWVPKDLLTVSIDATEPSSPIAKGTVALVTDGSATEDVPGLKLDEWEVSPPLKHKVEADYGVVGGLTVLESSQNKDAAMAWTKYLASPEHLKRFDKDRLYFPPRPSLTPLYDEAEDPIKAGEEQYVDSAIPGVIHPKARQLMDVIKPEIQSCLLGDKSPEEALEAAEKAVNGVIGSA